MQRKTITDEKGRNYEAMVDGDLSIIVGPGEGVVDALKLPEPIATELHNRLHAVGLLTFKDVAKNPRTVQGVIQEVLQLDVQRLTESYLEYEKEK